MNRYQDDDHDEEPDDRIDLAALDPSRDRARWAGLVDAVAARAARAAQARRPSIPRQVLVWARPTLALAAVAVAVWGTAYFAAREPEAEAAPAELLARWAQNDEVPATTQILEILGDTDGSD